MFEKNWLKSANRLKTLRNIAEAIAHEYTGELKLSLNSPLEFTQLR
jgi:hypothetical protein